MYWYIKFFLFFLFLSNSAFADSECFNIFNSAKSFFSMPKEQLERKALELLTRKLEERVMEIALNLQEQIEAIKTEANLLYGKLTTQTEKERLSQIILKLDTIFNEINEMDSFAPENWNNQGYETKVSELTSQVLNFSNPRESIRSEKDNHTIEGLISRWEESELKESGLKVLEDISYFVKFSNSHQAYKRANIYFDKSIADLFNKLNRKETLSLLRLIQKGFVPAPGIGLKILIQNQSSSSKYSNNLLEIHSKGSLGHIRVGGFLYKDQIHFVHFETGSDHSQYKMKEAFKKNIYQKMQRFLQTVEP